MNCYSNLSSDLYIVLHKKRKKAVAVHREDQDPIIVSAERAARADLERPIHLVVEHVVVATHGKPCGLVDVTNPFHAPLIDPVRGNVGLVENVCWNPRRIWTIPHTVMLQSYDAT